MKNGVSDSKAAQLFDLMEKFAGYGFNKSHSAAYALVSYQTAWLKAHHPDQFMAAVLSADMQHTDKIVTLVDEVRRSELPLDPPDINRSPSGFRCAMDGFCMASAPFEGSAKARSWRSAKVASGKDRFATCTTSADASMQRKRTGARSRR